MVLTHLQASGSLAISDRHRTRNDQGPKNPRERIGGLAGIHVAFVTVGVREQQQVADLAARNSILTITSDLACVQPVVQVVNLPAPSGVTRFANVGSFETYGISVAGSGRMARRVGWLANYTWTRVREALPSGGPPFAVTLAPAATTPEHVANIGLDYGGDRWFGAATARYTSSTRQFVFDRNAALLLLRVPRAIGVDARIGYHVTRHLDAYAAGENLTAAAGVAGSPVPADRRLRVGLNYTL